MSHSLVANARDLFMENATTFCGIWSMAAVLRFAPLLRAAEPHGEIFDPALCGGRAKKTDPASLFRMGSPEKERAELDRKRYE